MHFMRVRNTPCRYEYSVHIIREHSELQGICNIYFKCYSKYLGTSD